MRMKWLLKIITSFALHKVGLLISGLALLVPLSIYCQDVAFVNVNVVPMDRERVLGAQTVLISGGKIKAMGAVRKIALPKGTLRVDGTGKYLMPGLADMHGHLSHRGPAMAYPLETFPLLLVAHGVTTLRNMAGCPPVLSLRQQIEIGATLGPRIFTTGPVLEGKAALTADLAPTSAGAALVAAGPSQAQALFLETADSAAAEVEREKRESYDAVKVNTLLPAPAFEAVVRTAREVGLPVYGHVPRSVGLSGALSAGMRSIEHLAGYIEALQAADSPFRDSPFSMSNPRMAEYADVTKLRALATATRTAAVWNCPTLVTPQMGTLNEASARQRLELPVMRYVAPARRQLWEAQIRGLNSRFTTEDLSPSMRRCIRFE